MTSGSASATELTPLRDGDVTASKKRSTYVKVVAAVVAVAGCAAGASHLTAPGAFSSSVSLGEKSVGEKSVGEHIAMDKRLGPLTSDARTTARLGNFHTTDVPAPDCAELCLAASRST
jgi:hypothetical protein